MIIKNINYLILHNVVLFPGVESQVDLSYESDLRIAQKALENDLDVFILGSRGDDVFQTGVIAKIKQVVSIKNSSDSYSAVVYPYAVATRIHPYSKWNDDYRDTVEIIEETNNLSKEKEAAYCHTIVNCIEEFANHVHMPTSKFPQEIAYPDSLSSQIYFTAVFLIRDLKVQQELLEESDLEKRAKLLIKSIYDFQHQYDIEKELDEEIRVAAEQYQNEFFLQDKLNEIKRRLNKDSYFENDDDNEYEKYFNELALLPLENDVKENLLKECKRFSMLQPSSPDANVIRNYFDEILKLPWGKYTQNPYSSAQEALINARKILDNDHYGLEKIKIRFMELIAVNHRTDDAGVQILCLVGPPGVGKTSVVESVARAMGRKYVRMSLGGVHDEAEIRGHRKTYIGAMPGRIANAIKEAKSMNPVILMDEIDKMAQDMRGDPASALLEVLDPAQNSTFRDNYLEIPLDLSKAIFVTTANDPSGIPGPLYDRMEIIEVPSYTFEDKMQIAKKYLVKKQRKIHKLTAQNLKIADSALAYLINYYTKEAGVRRLEQLIASICRKTVVELDIFDKKSISVNIKKIKEWFGGEKFKGDDANKKDLTGVVNGLAWTSVGGEMLQVEALAMPGSGKIEITGNLGNVMQESAKAAYSFIRANADKFKIKHEIFSKTDIHIHVPQGAVPKDGPSAGVTISTAILSALTNKPVKHEIAMTGEISLTGKVLPIGGLREKSMAAYKNNIKTVIIPTDNIADLDEIAEKVKNKLEFHQVSNLNEVFKLALEMN